MKKHLNVLMFGWEFAPIYSGGLGVACAGLVKALIKQGADVTFVLPKLPPGFNEDKLGVVSAENYGPKLTIKHVKSLLSAYVTNEQYAAVYDLYKKKHPGAALYGPDLISEVARFAEAAKKIAKDIPHDVIHCHDWMTYPAGIAAKKVSHKPLVMHVHATEYDRTGGLGNLKIHALEQQGFEEADHIVAVSNFTKKKVAENYDIPESKITAIHNAIKPKEASKRLDGKKIVLFLGRLTKQKGPDWFLAAAKKVLDADKNVTFVIAGSGDMEPATVEAAAALGIADKVLFTGFLTGDDIDRAYRMADVYVMPSISEPFGLTALEAMSSGTPTIISKQSGVSEVVKNCLKVDYWDTEAMADKILGVLAYNELKKELGLHGSTEAQQFSWKKPAENVLALYGQLRKRK